MPSVCVLFDIYCWLRITSHKPFFRTLCQKNPKTFKVILYKCREWVAEVTSLARVILEYMYKYIYFLLYDIEAAWDNEVGKLCTCAVLISPNWRLHYPKKIRLSLLGGTSTTRVRGGGFAPLIIQCVRCVKIDKVEAGVDLHGF